MCQFPYIAFPMQRTDFQLPSGMFEAPMCLNVFVRGRRRRLDVVDSYPWVCMGEQQVF